MTEISDSSSDREPKHLGPLPQGLATGSTVLVAGSGDPSHHAVDFQILARLGADADTALVVATTESADQTVSTYRDRCPDGERPSLGVVDTVSREQSISALYDDAPVVFTPSPTDLERLVVGLTELSDPRPPPDGARHLLVRSLSPILETTSVARVCTVLQQITGIRTEDGISLVGVDYTAHDEATMAALTEQVDGVLWTTSGSTDTLALDYEPARSRHGHTLSVPAPTASSSSL